MNLPKLKTARVLSDEEMLIFRGGKCSTCKKACSDGCKSSCKPGNSNTGSGNELDIIK